MITKSRLNRHFSIHVTDAYGTNWTRLGYFNLVNEGTFSQVVAPKELTRWEE